MALAGVIPAGMLAHFLPSCYRDPAYQIIAFTAFTGGTIPTDFSMIAMAAANLLILIPYYLATVPCECRIVESRYPEIDRKLIGSAVRLMNRITYSVLALVVLSWLTTAIVSYRNQAEEPDAAPERRIGARHSE
jgi:hypothetical protein